VGVRQSDARGRLAPLRLNLEHRVAIVGGASRGIGLAIAEQLASEGARLALVARGEAALRAEASRLESAHPGSVIAVPGDLIDPRTAVTAVEQALARWSTLDIVVANAGTGAGPSGWQLTDEDWQAGFDRNFTAARRLIDASLPAMLRSDRGSIVVVGSIVALEALPAPLPYTVAKAAIAAYVKSLARQVGSSGVRVNAVIPGNILFPGGGWDRKRQADPDGVRSYIQREVALQRFGTPAEIASCVTFLCSDRSSFVTGAMLLADGGQTRGFAP
jgi:3-oxoacyl-[acyl-carrier protein] reductase